MKGRQAREKVLASFLARRALAKASIVFRIPFIFTQATSYTIYYNK
jgi:hypothetical protein